MTDRKGKSFEGLFDKEEIKVARKPESQKNSNPEKKKSGKPDCQKIKITTRLNPETVKNLKIFAINEQRSIEEIMQEAIDKYLIRKTK